MAERSRMNALQLKTSESAASGKIELTTNLGKLGAKVAPLVPSQNPGSCTSPSAQAAEMPGHSPSKTKSLGLPAK